MSLLREEPCIDLRNVTATTTRRIQRVQERRFAKVHVYTCLVAVKTTKISSTLEGYLDTSGKCQGVKYTVNKIQYEKVADSAAVTIKIHDYDAVANVEENKINMRTGTVCPNSANYCFDDLAGVVSWKLRNSNRCSTTGINVLFECTATILAGEHSGGRRDRVRSQANRPRNSLPATSLENRTDPVVNHIRHLARVLLPAE